MMNAPTQPQSAVALLGAVKERNPSQAPVAPAPPVAGGFPAVDRRDATDALQQRLRARRDARFAAAAASPPPSLLQTGQQAQGGTAAGGAASGSSGGAELSAIARENEARVANMDPSEREAAIAEIESMFSEGTLAAMRQRHLKKLQQPVGDARSMSVRAPPAAPPPLSSIATEEELWASAKAYLPPDELAKLAWTGQLGSGNVDDGRAEVAPMHSAQPAPHPAHAHPRHSHGATTIHARGGGPSPAPSSSIHAAFGDALRSAAVLAATAAHAERVEEASGPPQPLSHSALLSAALSSRLSPSMLAALLARGPEGGSGAGACEDSGPADAAAASIRASLAESVVAEAGVDSTGAHVTAQTLLFDRSGALLLLPLPGLQAGGSPPPPFPPRFACASGDGFEACHPLMHLCTLLRSVLPSQRIAASRSIAGLLARRRAAFIDPARPPAPWRGEAAAAAPLDAAAGTQMVNDDAACCGCCSGGDATHACATPCCALSHEPHGHTATLAPPPTTVPALQSSPGSDPDTVTAAWRFEAAALQRLALPPILPVLLRCASDDTHPGALVAGLAALEQLLGCSSSLGSGDYRLYTLSSSSSASSVHGVQLHGEGPAGSPAAFPAACSAPLDDLFAAACVAEAASREGGLPTPPFAPTLASVCALLRASVPPLVAPQPPPIQDIVLGGDGSGGGSLVFPQAPAPLSSAPQPQHTAADAALDGLLALEDPRAVLCDRMGLVERLAAIAGRVFAPGAGAGRAGEGTAGAPSSAAGATAAAASDAVVRSSVVRLLTAVAERGGSQARRVEAAVISGASRRGGGGSGVGLLPWLAHCALFSHAVLEASLLCGRVCADRSDSSGGAIDPQPTPAELRAALRCLDLAGDVMRLVRAVVSSDGDLALQLCCDEEAAAVVEQAARGGPVQGEGEGTEAGGGDGEEEEEMDSEVVAPVRWGLGTAEGAYASSSSLESAAPVAVGKLTLDPLLQFLPLSASLQRALVPAWMAPAVHPAHPPPGTQGELSEASDDNDDTAVASSTAPPHPLLQSRLRLAWETLRLLQSCCRHGAGVARALLLYAGSPRTTPSASAPVLPGLRGLVESLADAATAPRSQKGPDAPAWWCTVRVGFGVLAISMLEACASSVLAAVCEEEGGDGAPAGALGLWDEAEAGLKLRMGEQGAPPAGARLFPLALQLQSCVSHAWGLFWDVTGAAQRAVAEGGRDWGRGTRSSGPAPALLASSALLAMLATYLSEGGDGNSGGGDRARPSRRQGLHGPLRLAALQAPTLPPARRLSPEYLPHLLQLRPLSAGLQQVAAGAGAQPGPSIAVHLTEVTLWPLLCDGGEGPGEGGMLLRVLRALGDACGLAARIGAAAAALATHSSWVASLLRVVGTVLHRWGPVAMPHLGRLAAAAAVVAASPAGVSAAHGGAAPVSSPSAPWQLTVAVWRHLLPPRADAPAPPAHGDNCSDSSSICCSLLRLHQACPPAAGLADAGVAAAFVGATNGPGDWTLGGDWTPLVLPWRCAPQHHVTTHGALGQLGDAALYLSLALPAPPADAPQRRAATAAALALRLLPCGALPPANRAQFGLPGEGASSWGALGRVSRCLFSGAGGGDSEQEQSLLQSLLRDALLPPFPGQRRGSSSAASAALSRVPEAIRLPSTSSRRVGDGAAPEGAGEEGGTLPGPAAAASSAARFGLTLPLHPLWALTLLQVALSACGAYASLGAATGPLGAATGPLGAAKDTTSSGGGGDRDRGEAPLWSRRSAATLRALLGCGDEGGGGGPPATRTSALLLALELDAAAVAPPSTLPGSSGHAHSAAAAPGARRALSLMHGVEAAFQLLHAGLLPTESQREGEGGGEDVIARGMHAALSSLSLACTAPDATAIASPVASPSLATLLLRHPRYGVKGAPAGQALASASSGEEEGQGGGETLLHALSSALCEELCGGLEPSSAAAEALLWLLGAGRPLIRVARDAPGAVGGVPSTATACGLPDGPGSVLLLGGSFLAAAVTGSGGGDAAASLRRGILESLSTSGAGRPGVWPDSVDVLWAPQGAAAAGAAVGTFPPVTMGNNGAPARPASQTSLILPQLLWPPEDDEGVLDVWATLALAALQQQLDSCQDGSGCNPGAPSLLLHAAVHHLSYSLFGVMSSAAAVAAPAADAMVHRLPFAAVERARRLLHAPLRSRQGAPGLDVAPDAVETLLLMLCAHSCISVSHCSPNGRSDDAPAFAGERLSRLQLALRRAEERGGGASGRGESVLRQFGARVFPCSSP